MYLKRLSYSSACICSMPLARSVFSRRCTVEGEMSGRLFMASSTVTRWPAYQLRARKPRIWSSTASISGRPGSCRAAATRLRNLTYARGRTFLLAMARF